MSDFFNDDPEEPRRPTAVRTESRRPRPLVLTLIVMAVLLIGFSLFAGIWTDRLWFNSLGYGGVFTTLVWTKIGMFLVFGALMALAVGGNLWIAYRLRPVFRASSPEQANLDRYRDVITPLRRILLISISLVFALFAGGSASGKWRIYLLWQHRQSFGKSDAYFHKDIGFYVFTLPWLHYLVDFAITALILGLLAALVVHYVYGGIRLQARTGKVSGPAQAQISVVLGVLVLLKGADYYLDRFDLTSAGGGLVTGMTYSRDHATLPAKNILMAIAVICALLFFATLWRRTWSLPTIGFGLMVLSAILIGGLYPAIVQKFQVQPNEAAKEAPYIQKNIDATRAAYGIKDTRATPYSGTSPDSAATLRSAANTTAGVRLLDPNVVSPTFQQLQRNQGYYQFPSTLDVDRYTVDGQEQDTVVGMRELNVGGIRDNNWINDHFKYTHGYGIVAADGTDVTSGGAPVFTESDLPATGKLGGDKDYQQRIYFGEQTKQYSIVDGPTHELDYAGRTGETTTRYSGSGGVSLKNPVTRAAYAVSFGEPKILYSGAIGKDSKILYNRTPKERVEAVAPWLTIDGDPYPAVVGKHLEWVVDAYTTTNSYPYASRTTLGDTTADSLTDNQRTVVAHQNEVNYIRNSVKATVDAYDGTVTLYQWDTKDPVLKTWMKAFPHTVRPKADIPKDLLAHLRYPQDLFKVQRQLLTTYHVTNAQQFYSGSQAWQVPDDPTATTGKPVPPYYLGLKMPGRSQKDFSLTTTFTPNGQDNLSAFMAVDADASSSDYGTIRILRLPTSPTVDGPKQVQAKINSSNEAAAEINELKQYGSGSKVEYGNLLTVPLNGGLLYIEPVYVRGQLNYPLMRKVAVVYGNSTGYQPTLSQALDDVFKVKGGTTPPPTATPPPTTGTSPPTTTGTPPPASRDDTAIQQALADAQSAYDAGQKAMQKGDWGAYGEAQKKLANALKRAREAEGQPAGPPKSG
jgi:uncharacterized membrane protein (UPF0182 family)